MKKILILISLLGVGLMAYFLIVKDKGQEAPHPQENLIPESAYNDLNDTQKNVFSKVFDKKTLNSKPFVVFTDPNTTGLFYLREAKLNAKEGKEFLKKAFEGLKDCAKEGCGQGPDDDGFYDPANTVAMISIKRILETALIDPESLEVKEWLSKDDLLNYLDTPNSKVRKLALKNLLTLYPGKQTIQDVMNTGKELKGYQAGDIVEALVPYANKGDKEAFVTGVIDIMRGKDPLTITEVLEKSEMLRVNQEQIERMGSELCPYKRELGQEGNFKAMSYSLKIMATGSGFSFNLNHYCR